jgi:hypothetical protein
MSPLAWLRNRLDLVADDRAGATDGWADEVRRWVAAERDRRRRDELCAKFAARAARRTYAWLHAGDPALEK